MENGKWKIQNEKFQFPFFVFRLLRTAYNLFRKLPTAFGSLCVTLATNEISPTLQRWVRLATRNRSPVGTVELRNLQPSLTRLKIFCSQKPRVETRG